MATVLSHWTVVPASGAIPSYQVFTQDLQKPDLDDRQYQVIELQNGLRAIVIRDSSTDKAAACLTIATGSLQDPSDMQGLAHFCEHMITKGSALYPKENDFMSYITSNGGIRNAVTGPSYAYYWFSIGPAQLSGALSRLAAFFHSPLFTPSLTAREIHAVDAESRRNAQNDVRRILQINKELTSPRHPYSQFGTGNHKSLTEAAKRLEKEGRLPAGENTEGDGGPVEREIQRRLVEWWEHEYCAGRMTLAVLGRESLEELTGLVVPLFSPILNRGLDPRPIFKQRIWEPSQTGIIVFLKTVKDMYGLSLDFTLLDQRDNYEMKPAHVLAHFIGHEGPGSVCAYLKKKGWLVSITAAPTTRNNSVQRFRVSCTLTKDGYAHHEHILLAIFNYISLLRTSPLEAYHFEEMSTMAEIRFRFQEKVQPHTYVSGLAYELSESYPPECILSGASLFREWDEALVRETLEALTLGQGRVMLEAREHSEEIVGKDAQWQAERWYGGEYCVRRMDPAFVEKTHAANENRELSLPRPNPYIPTNLAVNTTDVSAPSKSPSCIHRTSTTTLWFKKDDQFWVPKAQIRVDIRSPLAYGTPRQAVLTRLLADLLEDALSEVTYDARLAGLTYSVTNHSRGLLVSVNGYNDKLPDLLQTVMRHLKDLSISPERLKVVAEQAKLHHQNFYLGQPSNLSEEFSRWLLMPVIWTPADKLSEIDLICASDVERHRDALLAKVHLEVLVNGNVEQQQAVDTVRSIEECLDARALAQSESPRLRSLIIPPGANFVMRKVHANSKEANNSLSYSCQFGDVADPSLRPVLEFLVHVMKEPCFTQLRTKEQLGYVVATLLWTVASSTGLSIKIQSSKAPWYLEERVESFLESFRGTLEAMPADVFEAKKEGLVVRKRERAKNLQEESTRFWGYISSGYCDFLRHEMDAEAIRALTREDVLEAFDRYVVPSSGSRSRKKISLHLVSQQVTELTRMTEGAVLVAEDSESLFKASLGCYPAAVPVTPAFVTTHGLL
ncbi:LuxS/MPP-like metallohydrolase [Amylocystis lapponica]|nr:LuxS/MPP-like metallohydrolase [Amylocystis lapponica]